MKRSFFNDPYFNRAKQYVINTITEEEILLYKDGHIRKIYSSFEELLLDNIQYYSRIIRTILWLYENVLIQDGERLYSEKKPRYKIPMTCTKFYYLIMLDNSSTQHEIHYGYPQLGKTRATTFQGLFKKLIEIGSFAFNVVYTTERYKTKSYQRAFNSDITDENYLYRITNFTDDILFIETKNLKNDISSLIKISEKNEILYNEFSKFNKNKKLRNTLNVLPNRIHYKSINGEYKLDISSNTIKKYISSHHTELLEFDSFVNKNMKLLHKINTKRISYYLNNIRVLCVYMMNEYGSNFIAVKKHHGSDDYSVIRVKGAWKIFMIEEIKYNKLGEVIYEDRFYKGSTKKVSEYLFDYGYYLFGHKSQEQKILEMGNFDKPMDIMEHYEGFVNQRFMSSQYKLEILQYQTQKIVNFLIQSFIIG